MNLSAELDRWLAPGMRDVLERLGVRASELGWRAFLVGGPVRDLLLGRTSLDLDVVVEGDAVTLAREIARPGEPAPVVHTEFGTATIRAGTGRVDLVTARAESYDRPGALPSVRPGSIEDDLARRDFSLNAMALALNGEGRGELVDPHGGRRDLEHGLIRVLHGRSFIDDATRMLRGVRYEQRFGFAFEPGTLSLVERDLAYLDCVSGDRVRHELERTFEEEEPEQALRRLDVLGLLSALHSGLGFGPRRVDALLAARRGSLSSSVLPGVCWCVLAWGLDAGALPSLRARLNVRRSVSEGIADALVLKELEPRLDLPEVKPAEVFDLLHGRSYAALLVAGLLFDGPRSRANVALYLSRLRHVRPALAGHDLLQLGFTDGPALGRALAALRSARLNGEIVSRHDEMALALRLLSASRL